MRQLLCQALAILGMLSALGFVLGSAETSAHADSKWKDALITVGIGTAAGSALGLSTIPFYGYPEDHLGNVLIGAGVGLVAGIGVAIYLLTTPENGGEAAHGPVTDGRGAQGSARPAEISSTHQTMRSQMRLASREARFQPFTQQLREWRLAANVIQLSF